VSKTNAERWYTKGYDVAQVFFGAEHPLDAVWDICRRAGDDEGFDFVRVGKIKRAPADPRALARRAAELTGGARVEIADQAAPASFELDSMRVEQALVNLLRNALQVSPPGTPVQLKVAKETGGLLFVVADRGAGVPADLRERIFEPFVSGRTQGTGLGLAVVSRVAELHGGRAEVADRPGGGSEFSLWLPDEPAKGA
jgi:signal transduction histidine kinase